MVWKDNRSSQSHYSCSISRKERVRNYDIGLSLCTIQDASCETMVCFENGIRSLGEKQMKGWFKQDGLYLGKYPRKNLYYRNQCKIRWLSLVLTVDTSPRGIFLNTTEKDRGNGDMNNISVLAQSQLLLGIAREICYIMGYKISDNQSTSFMDNYT